VRAASPVSYEREVWQGGHDADREFVSADQLHVLTPTPSTLPGLGHNAHVEDPRAVAALLDRYR
jgi:hypothetical protein